MSLSIFFVKQLLRVIGIFNGEKYKYSQKYGLGGVSYVNGE